MARSAKLDSCGNCRFWDTSDENLSEEDRAEDRGVCRIMSYPDELDNGFAFVEVQTDEDGDPDHTTGIVITAEEFFCNLYKVE